MPLDPSIALQGKPVDIKPVNYNELFKTLAQMRYLGAETQAAEEEAARKQALFGETAAAGGYLASLGKGSAPRVSSPTAPSQPGAQTGGPPFSDEDLRVLKPGESTPAPGSPAPAGPGQGAPGTGTPGQPQATRPPLSIMDPEVHGELYRLAPHVASDFIKSALDVQTSRNKFQEGQLELAQKLFEHGTRSLALVHDEPTYQAWRLSMATQVPPATMAMIPERYSPEAVTQLQQSGQAFATQFAQSIEAGKQKIEQQNADTQRILADTGKKAEARQAEENLVLHGEQGDVLAKRFGPLPSGTGMSAPVPGTERPRTEGETKAKGQLDLAAASNGRIALLEANMASKGKGLDAIVPSLAEELKMTKGGALGNKFLDPARREYYGEMLNFIAAVRGEETSRISPETFNIEARRFFPIAGDREADVLRKRQVREDALNDLATRTNRPQGMVPRGQTRMTTPGSPVPAAAPHTPQVYTRAQVSALAAKHQMSEAAIEALIKADGDRVAP